LSERSAEMKRHTLLLVDDDDDFRTSMGQALGHRGFDVTPAENGERAVALTHERTFDIAVLDLKMPGQGGIETLTEIRKRHRSLPVIILTGHGALDDAMAGIALGIVDFINKPVDADKLAERLRALLKDRIQLFEHGIADVMAPVERFPRAYADEPLKSAAVLLAEAFAKNGGTDEPCLLVYDRREHFLGVAEVRDLLRILPPAPLRTSPYASYLTGMFLAQAMLIETLKVEELLDPDAEQRALDIRAPLMEAAHHLAAGGRAALAITEDGEPRGVLTARRLAREVCRIVLKDESV
jgi:ActR/RegA family two-component response regulator